ncbi:ABC transporter permease [bacterium]|nr:ABC transporter permease [bacterium]MCI0606516.1 ABC transporter permease [bacterium]
MNLQLLSRRLILLLPLSLAILTIVFSFLRILPGDPVEAMLGEGAQQADVESMREQLLLDQPLWRQYVLYLWNVLHGDFGSSWSFQMPVTELILSRFPATVEMAVAGMLIALMIAFPLGILAAKHPNTWTDRVTTIFAVSGAAIPHFWLGPLFILLFSITIGWFPVSGRGSLAHLVLPALTLGTALAAILMRMLRSSLLEELRADYIRTARAKGASEMRILFGHAIRNALLPVVTLLALQFGSLLTGAVITETIFSWPGLGRLLIQAIFSRDYPLVQGCVLIFAMLYLFANLIADLLYGVLDPRIQN